REAEREPGMLSISVMAGFAYADVPEMGASIIAVADGDRALAERNANAIADRMWEVREQLNVESPKPEEAVRQAIASARTPVVLGQLTSLGIDPKAAGAIVVKAAVAYKAAYDPIAGAIIEVDTQGLTAINPARFEYQRIRRPLYPLQ